MQISRFVFGMAVCIAALLTASALSSTFSSSSAMQSQQFTPQQISTDFLVQDPITWVPTGQTVPNQADCIAQNLLRFDSDLNQCICKPGRTFHHFAHAGALCEFKAMSVFPRIFQGGQLRLPVNTVVYDQVSELIMDEIPTIPGRAFVLQLWQYVADQWVKDDDYVNIFSLPSRLNTNDPTPSPFNSPIPFTSMERQFYFTLDSFKVAPGNDNFMIVAQEVRADGLGDETLPDFTGSNRPFYAHPLTRFRAMDLETYYKTYLPPDFAVPPKCPATSRPLPLYEDPLDVTQPKCHCGGATVSGPCLAEVTMVQSYTFTTVSKSLYVDVAFLTESSAELDLLLEDDAVEFWSLVRTSNPNAPAAFPLSLTLTIQTTGQSRVELGSMELWLPPSPPSRLRNLALSIVPSLTKSLPADTSIEVVFDIKNAQNDYVSGTVQHPDTLKSHSPIPLLFPVKFLDTSAVLPDATFSTKCFPSGTMDFNTDTDDFSQCMCLPGWTGVRCEFRLYISQSFANPNTALTWTEMPSAPSPQLQINPGQVLIVKAVPRISDALSQFFLDNVHLGIESSGFIANGVRTLSEVRLSESQLSTVKSLQWIIDPKEFSPVGLLRIDMWISSILPFEWHLHFPLVFTMPSSVMSCQVPSDQSNSWAYCETNEQTGAVTASYCKPGYLHSLPAPSTSCISIFEPGHTDWANGRMSMASLIQFLPGVGVSFTHRQDIWSNKSRDIKSVTVQNPTPAEFFLSDHFTQLPAIYSQYMWVEIEDSKRPSLINLTYDFVADPICPQDLSLNPTWSHFGQNCDGKVTMKVHRLGTEDKHFIVWLVEAPLSFVKTTTHTAQFCTASNPTACSTSIAIDLTPQQQGSAVAAQHRALSSIDNLPLTTRLRWDGTAQFALWTTDPTYAQMCSGHGSWNFQTGALACTCDPGWFGKDCHFYFFHEQIPTTFTPQEWYFFNSIEVHVGSIKNDLHLLNGATLYWTLANDPMGPHGLPTPINFMSLTDNADFDPKKTNNGQFTMPVPSYHHGVSGTVDLVLAIRLANGQATTNPNSKISLLPGCPPLSADQVNVLCGFSEDNDPNREVFPPTFVATKSCRPFFFRTTATGPCSARTNLATAPHNTGIFVPVLYAGDFRAKIPTKPYVLRHLFKPTLFIPFEDLMIWSFSDPLYTTPPKFQVTLTREGTPINGLQTFNFAQNTQWQVNLNTAQPAITANIPVTLSIYVMDPDNITVRLPDLVTQIHGFYIGSISTLHETPDIYPLPMMCPPGIGINRPSLSQSLLHTFKCKCPLGDLGTYCNYLLRSPIIPTTVVTNDELEYSVEYKQPRPIPGVPREFWPDFGTSLIRLTGPSLVTIQKSIAIDNPTIPSNMVFRFKIGPQDLSVTFHFRPIPTDATNEFSSTVQIPKSAGSGTGANPPCENGAVAEGPSNVCICPKGFGGVTCEVAVDTTNFEIHTLPDASQWPVGIIGAFAQRNFFSGQRLVLPKDNFSPYLGQTVIVDLPLLLSYTLPAGQDLGFSLPFPDQSPSLLINVPETTPGIALRVGNPRAHPTPAPSIKIMDPCQFLTQFDANNDCYPQWTSSCSPQSTGNHNCQCKRSVHATNGNLWLAFGPRCHQRITLLTKTFHPGKKVAWELDQVAGSRVLPTSRDDFRFELKGYNLDDPAEVIPSILESQLDPNEIAIRPETSLLPNGARAPVQWFSAQFKWELFVYIGGELQDKIPITLVSECTAMKLSGAPKLCSPFPYTTSCFDPITQSFRCQCKSTYIVQDNPVDPVDVMAERPDLVKVPGSTTCEFFVISITAENSVEPHPRWIPWADFGSISFSLAPVLPETYPYQAIAPLTRGNDPAVVLSSPMTFSLFHQPESSSAGWDAKRFNILTSVMNPSSLSASGLHLDLDAKVDHFDFRFKFPLEDVPANDFRLHLGADPTFRLNDLGIYAHDTIDFWQGNDAQDYNALLLGWSLSSHSATQIHTVDSSLPISADSSLSNIISPWLHWSKTVGPFHWYSTNLGLVPPVQIPALLDLECSNAAVINSRTKQYQCFCGFSPWISGEHCHVAYSLKLGQPNQDQTEVSKPLAQTVLPLNAPVTLVATDLFSTTKPKINKLTQVALLSGEWNPASSWIPTHDVTNETFDLRVGDQYFYIYGQFERSDGSTIREFVGNAICETISDTCPGSIAPQIDRWQETFFRPGGDYRPSFCICPSITFGETCEDVIEPVRTFLPQPKTSQTGIKMELATFTLNPQTQIDNLTFFFVPATYPTLTDIPPTMKLVLDRSGQKPVLSQPQFTLQQLTEHGYLWDIIAFDGAQPYAKVPFTFDPDKCSALDDDEKCFGVGSNTLSCLPENVGTDLPYCICSDSSFGPHCEFQITNLSTQTPITRSAPHGALAGHELEITWDEAFVQSKNLAYRVDLYYHSSVANQIDLYSFSMEDSVTTGPEALDIPLETGKVTVIQPFVQPRANWDPAVFSYHHFTTRPASAPATTPVFTTAPCVPLQPSALCTMSSAGDQIQTPVITSQISPDGETIKVSFTDLSDLRPKTIFKKSAEEGNKTNFKLRFLVYNSVTQQFVYSLPGEVKIRDTDFGTPVSVGYGYVDWVSEQWIMLNGNSVTLDLQQIDLSSLLDGAPAGSLQLHIQPMPVDTDAILSKIPCAGCVVAEGEPSAIYPDAFYPLDLTGYTTKLCNGPIAQMCAQSAPGASCHAPSGFCSCPATHFTNAATCQVLDPARPPPGIFVCPQHMALNDAGDDCICKTQICEESVFCSNLYFEPSQDNHETIEKLGMAFYYRLQRELTMHLELTAVGREPVSFYTDSTPGPKPFGTEILDIRPTSGYLRSEPYSYYSDPRYVTACISFSPIRSATDTSAVPIVKAEADARIEHIRAKLQKVFTNPSTSSQSYSPLHLFKTIYRPEVLPVGKSVQMVQQTIGAASNAAVVCRRELDWMSPDSFYSTQINSSPCPNAQTTPDSPLFLCDVLDVATNGKLNPHCVDSQARFLTSNWYPTQPQFCSARFHSTFPATLISATKDCRTTLSLTTATQPPAQPNVSVLELDQTQHPSPTSPFKHASSSTTWSLRIPHYTSALAQQPATLNLLYYPHNADGSFATTPIRALTAAIPLTGSEVVFTPPGNHPLTIVGTRIVPQIIFPVHPGQNKPTTATLHGAFITSHATCMTPPADNIHTNPWVTTCAAGSTCTNDNKCTCQPGYVQNGQVCSPPCSHCNQANLDSCSADFECQCKPGWSVESHCNISSGCQAESVKKCRFPNGFLASTSPTTCAQQCTCNAPWSGSSCTSCSTMCQNGGQVLSTCSQCGCRAGFTGDTCACRGSTATITLYGWNDVLISWPALVAAYGKLESKPDHYYEAQGYLDLAMSEIINMTSEDMVMGAPSIRLAMVSGGSSVSGQHTKFTFSFTFGCDDFSPEIDNVDLLTRKWHDLQTTFAAHPVIRRWFTFPTEPREPDFSEPEKTPPTLPTEKPNTTSRQFLSTLLSFIILAIMFLTINP